MANLPTVRRPSISRAWLEFLLLEFSCRSGVEKGEAEPIHMAHRIIFNIVFTGARAVARSVAESWKQASANSQYAKNAAQAEGTGGSNTLSSAGLTLDEACKILNVAPPKAGKMDTEMMVARFKKLYDNNEPKNGGSFYLQSKVLRARERIELEVRRAEEEEAIREGSKPWNN